MNKITIPAYVLCFFTFLFVDMPVSRVVAQDASLKAPQTLDESAWQAFWKAGGQMNSPDEAGMTVARKIFQDQPFRSGFWKLMLDHGADANVANELGITLLMKAVATDESLAKRCVEKGADVNAVAKDGKTVLEYALEGTPETLRFLIAHGADAKQKNARGGNLLTTALGAKYQQPGLLEKLEVLIEAGADVNVEEEKTGYTPMFCALQVGDLSACRLLLKHGADAKKDLRVGIGNPLIFTAALFPDVELMEDILSRGVDVNSRNVYRETVLFPAVRTGDIPMCEMLLKRGVDINAVSKDSVTAIFGAVKANDEAMVRFLLEKGAITYKAEAKPEVNEHGEEIPVEVAGATNRYIINEAARNGNLEMVKLLTRHGAQCLDELSKQQDTFRPILHDAVAGESLPVCQYVLVFNPNLDVRDKSTRRTALHQAVVNLDLEICTFLLSQGADVNALDSNRKTPLALIMRGLSGPAQNQQEKTLGTLRITQLLLEAGASLEQKTQSDDDIVMAMKNVRFPYLAKYIQLRAGRWFDESRKPDPIQMAAYDGNLAQLEKLWNENESRTLVDADGESLLHYAVRGNRIEACRFLLEKGADITLEAKGCWNGTPLHFAAGMGFSEIIRLFHEKGADLNLGESLAGRTPLHWAVASQQGATVVELIKLGARTDTLDKKSQSPFTYALMVGRQSYCRYMVANGFAPADVLAKSTYKAFMGGKATTAAWRPEKRNNLDILIQCGIDVNLQDANGDTMLHFLVEGGSLEYLREALRHGGNPEIKNKKGKTPLELTVSPSFLRPPIRRTLEALLTRPGPQ